MKRHSTRAARAMAAALATITAWGCGTAPGPTMAEAVPDLDARVGHGDGALAGAHGRAWDAPDDRWDGARPLDARTAVDLALAGNRALRRAVAEVERRRAWTQDAQLAPNPVMNVAGGIPVDMGVVPVLAMVGQQVDWLWKRDAIVGEADAQLRALLFEAAATAVTTAAEARSAYVATAGAIEVEALARRDVEVAARILAATQAAFDAGDATAAAVNEARMNAAEAQNRAMEASLDLVAQKTRLLEAMGRGAEGLGWVTADAGARTAREACGVTAPDAADDDALRALVRERRLDLRAAEARVDGAEARVALARLARLPGVMLGAGWERDMEDDSAVMLQAQLTVPIFNDGRFRLAAAERDLEIARIDADATWQRAVVDARRALERVTAAEHHEATLRGMTLASFEGNLEILRAAVEAGDRPAVQLWRSEHQENHIRIQLARAERDRALAALGFEQALAGARLPAMQGGSLPALDPGGMGMSGAGGGLGPIQTFDFASMEAMQ
jgi:outer membrane protein TolC